MTVLLAELNPREFIKPSTYVDSSIYEKAKYQSFFLGAAASLEHSYGWVKNCQLITSLYSYALERKFAINYLSPAHSIVATLKPQLSVAAGVLQVNFLVTSALKLLAALNDIEVAFQKVRNCAEDPSALKRENDKFSDLFYNKLCFDFNSVLNNAVKVTLYAEKFFFAVALRPYHYGMTVVKCSTEIFDKTRGLLVSYELYMNLSNRYNELQRVKKMLCNVPGDEVPLCIQAIRDSEVEESDSQKKRKVREGGMLTIKPTGSSDYSYMTTASDDETRPVVSKFVSLYLVESDKVEISKRKAYTDCIRLLCEISMAVLELSMTVVLPIPMYEELMLGLWSVATAGNIVGAYDGFYEKALDGVIVSANASQGFNPKGHVICEIVP